jgi:hypothetical protein
MLTRVGAGLWLLLLLLLLLLLSSLLSADGDGRGNGPPAREVSDAARSPPAESLTCRLL